MHHTGKKESKKEKEKKIRSRRFKPGLSEYVRTKNERLYPLDDLDKRWQLKFKRGIYSFSMVIDSFQADDFFDFRVEFNL